MTRRQIVFFGSYDTALHPRVAVLRDGLAATNDVVQINERLGLSTADKIDAASSVSGAARLAVAIARAWIPLARRALREPRRPDAVVVGYMGHFDVHLARLMWPRSTIVLDHLVGLADTSKERGVATGLKARVLDLLDRLAFAAAHVVVVDTEEQRARLAKPAQRKAVVVPVGATSEWFDQPAPPPPPPLRVCFVGLYTSLHGAPIIGEAIDRLAADARIPFTMIGTGQELDATRVAAARNPRVEWIDWVPSEELAATVASHHVSLGIFGTTPKALAVVPTKAYQGLAAGTIVVTSDTAPQRRALGGHARFVPPGDGAALAKALRDLADEMDSSTTRSDGLGDDEAPTPPGHLAPGPGAAFRPEAVVAAIIGRLDELLPTTRDDRRPTGSKP